MTGLVPAAGRWTFGACWGFCFLGRRVHPRVRWRSCEGYLAGHVAAQLVKGTLKPAPGVKFTAGKLGEREFRTNNIVFTGPRYKEGKLETPAYVTVFHNGVVVQNHAEILGNTGHKTLGKYDGKTEKGPIGLQDHGNPVRYRNIWIRPLKGYDE